MVPAQARNDGAVGGTVASSAGAFQEENGAAGPAAGMQVRAATTSVDTVPPTASLGGDPWQDGVIPLAAVIAVAAIAEIGLRRMRRARRASALERAPAPSASGAPPATIPDATAWRSNIEHRLAIAEAQVKQLSSAAGPSGELQREALLKPAKVGEISVADAPIADDALPPSPPTHASRMQLAERMSRLAEKLASESRPKPSHAASAPKSFAPRLVAGVALVVTSLVILIAVQRSFDPGPSRGTAPDAAMEAPTASAEAAAELATDAPLASTEVAAADAIALTPAQEVPTIDDAVPSPAAPATYTTSFDCGSATAADERQICQNARLAAADVSLHESYFRLQSRLGVREQTALRASQREWLNARRRCASSVDPVACLSEVYARRQAALRGQAQALRARAAVAPAVPAGSGAVRCVLPTGERIATTLLDCRERSGVRLPS